VRIKAKILLLFVLIAIVCINAFSYEISSPYLEKMNMVKQALGFTDGYTPKYFNSPTDYVNVLNNNNLHFENKIFTADNSPVTESPVKIAWDSYIGKNKKGKEVAPDYAMIVVPGSAGSYFQFSEYMYDLQKASGQKIAFFMMDNRGQGLSTWFNPNKKAGFNGLYVDDFSNYVRDLKYFYSFIVKPEVARLELKYNKKIPIYAYGHSLGGGIIARYMEVFSYDFDGAILSSPAIKALSWPERTLAYWAIYSIILQGGGANYVPTGHNIHKAQSFDSVFCQTTNKDRWYYWQKMQDPSFFDNKSLVHPDSGGEILRMSYPTFWWTYQLIKGTNPTSNPGNACQVRTPYIILQAGKDKLVSLDAMFEFLRNTPRRLGTLIKFPDSKHDIMFEDDYIRDQSLEEIMKFMKSRSPEQHTLFSLMGI
jgi:lysophospholipase